MKTCPPPCVTGEYCVEERTCTPENCEYGQKGWECMATHVVHHCAHDWKSGPWVEMEHGGTSSCICGMTAMGHGMRYGP